MGERNFGVLFETFYSIIEANDVIRGNFFIRGFLKPEIKLLAWPITVKYSKERPCHLDPMYHEN